jgi:hypothetical protein
MNSIVAAFGEVSGRAGDRAAARRILGQLTARAAAQYVPATSFALVHLGLGERQEALRYLEQGCERHDISMVSLNTHPIYDDLRREPRFEALLRRMRFR